MSCCRSCDKIADLGLHLHEKNNFIADVSLRILSFNKTCFLWIICGCFHLEIRETEHWQHLFNVTNYQEPMTYFKCNRVSFSF